MFFSSTTIGIPPALPIIAMSEPDLCRNCRHYHGKTYSSTFFYCAIAPYGIDRDSSCDEYEMSEKSSDRLADSTVIIDEAETIFSAYMNLSEEEKAAKNVYLGL